MSKTNPLFESAIVNIPDVTGHDMSHEHLTSMEFGALHPTLAMELIPDSTVSVGNLTNVSLPPFACKFNGKVDLKTELFFVPYRLLWGAWKDFISGKNQTDINGTVPTSVPTFNMNSTEWSGDEPMDFTLLDQLGYNYGDTGADPYSKSMLFAMAYHKIWDSWYRDARLQHSAFNRTNRSGIWQTLCTLPYNYTTVTNVDPTGAGNLMFDGWPVFKYRRRNYGKDYFTTAIPTATEQGTKEFVSTTGNRFSIDALRSANALQKYAEKLAVVGDRYEDIIAATFGVRPSDAVMEKPILLGSSTRSLYSIGSKNTNDPTGVTSNNNPYAGFYGAESGKVDGTDGGSLCGKFTTSEYGVLMCIQSVVPHAYYEGIKLKDNDHITFTQFGNPAFASLGYEPIRMDELIPGAMDLTYREDIFGYADSYAEYKFRNDRVTGTLKRSENLSPFALKRHVHGDESISSDFLEIKNDVMDDVLTWHPDRTEVNNVVDEDGKVIFTLPDYYYAKSGEFEADCYWSIRVVNPLPMFTIPSLEPPKGNTRFVPKAGTRL